MERLKGVNMTKLIEQLHYLRDQLAQLKARTRFLTGVEYLQNVRDIRTVNQKIAKIFNTIYHH